MSEAERLYRALGRLPPRDAQRLMHRFVERRTTAECLALYGIPARSFWIHVHRAAALLRLALAAPEGPPLLPQDTPLEADESAGAAALSEQFDGGRAATTEAGELLARLCTHGGEILRLAQAAARQDEASPRRRREDWIRRLALAALVAGALWLYLRSGR